MGPVSNSSGRPTVIQGSFVSGGPRVALLMAGPAPPALRPGTVPSGAVSLPARQIPARRQTPASHQNALANRRPGNLPVTNTLQQQPARVSQAAPLPELPGRNVAQPHLARQSSHSPAIQRIANGQAMQLPANLANFGGGRGQPLPEPVRQKMESFFNTSFADVRVHVGAQASSIGALAFTQGSNLYFAPGQYNPHTMQGQRLLGHELTHVVQQRAGRVRNPFGSGAAVVQDRSMEAEADRMGMQVASRSTFAQAYSNAPAEPRTIQRSIAIGVSRACLARGDAGLFLPAPSRSFSTGVIQRVMAYRVEYPTYKIQISGNKVTGFRGNPDGKGINISFVLPDHSTYFASERSQSQLKGLRLVTFQLDDDLWKAIEWKASNTGEKSQLKKKWLDKVEKLKSPSWSDGSNLTKFTKKTALGFNDDWLDVLEAGVIGTASVEYYEDSEEGLTDDDDVYAYMNDEIEGGAKMTKAEAQLYDSYMTVAKAKRLGYLNERS